jgi:adenylate cyclase
LSSIVPSLAVRDETNPVIHWLMTEARRHTDPNEFLEAFAHELRAADVDVSRITTGVPILHPQIFSFSGLWELGKGTTERLYRSGPEVAPTMANSPIRIAYQGGGPVRCDLTLPPQPDEFAILEDLRREGFTDYIVHSVPFADGSHKALSLATRRPGGFNADEVALFAATIPAVAFNLEVQALRRTARTLLDTYVGQQSGGRVLEGQIQRGSGETIRAVIWLCDLRGFTSLSEKLPRDELIDLLNCYFGPMCDAVAKEGGEILKFIGDAMLAIFPIGEDVCCRLACRRRCAGRVGGRKPAPRKCAPAAHRLRPRAACRRRHVRQYRQRYPARLHRDRARGQFDLAHRIDVPATRPPDIAVGRLCRGGWACRAIARGICPEGRRRRSRDFCADRIAK